MHNFGQNLVGVSPSFVAYLAPRFLATPLHINYDQEQVKYCHNVKQHMNEGKRVNIILHVSYLSAILSAGEVILECMVYYHHKHGSAYSRNEPENAKQGVRISPPVQNSQELSLYMCLYSYS